MVLLNNELISYGRSISTAYNKLTRGGWNLQLFAVEMKYQESLCVMENYMPFLHPAKQKKISQLIRYEDKLRAFIADILIRALLCRKMNVKNDRIYFRFNSFGKPRLEEEYDIHFNISHSGEWVVCAIDSVPIGIDVQKILPVDLSIAERFFSKEEYRDLMSIDDKDKLHYFYDLWTLKESYVKAIGTGLSTPLDSISFCLTKGVIVFESNIESKPYHFKQYELDPNYRLSVCTEDIHFQDQIQRLNIDDTIEMFKNVIV